MECLKLWWRREWNGFSLYHFILISFSFSNLVRGYQRLQSFVKILSQLFLQYSTKCLEFHKL